MYPDPDWITLTSLKFFLDNVLNLWIPLAVVAVENPIVLIPAKSRIFWWVSQTHSLIFFVYAIKVWQKGKVKVFDAY